MNLTSPKTIKELFLTYHLKPSKGLGQNFLMDQTILEKIITASEIHQDDVILEVGPGIGTLTQELAKKANRVIAIEKDKRMVEILKETLREYSNIEIVNQDILEFSIFNDQLSNYKVVANIPYYLTSPLIRKFLESEQPPSHMILMIQKEVAQRICANPPHMSLLAVSVQYYADPKIISYVKKECFWPKPRVDSAIIKILHINKQRERVKAEKFFEIVKAGFSQPRKQLAGNLSKKLKQDKNIVITWLTANSIKPEQRAETLNVSDWKRLVSSLVMLGI